MEIVAIEKQVQVVEDVNEVVVTIVEREATVIEAIPVFAIYNSNGATITRIKLSIQINGQTQFNIFSPPSSEHWLIVNGVEEYVGRAYQVQNVSGNWRIVWLNLYQLRTDMELIFVTKNS